MTGRSYRVHPALPGTPVSERFWRRVVQRGPDECWEWLGGHGPTGYAPFTWRESGKVTSTPAHRFMYEQIQGAIPPGFEIDHLCRNRGCLNPAHLEAVTRAENVRRSVPHMTRGTDNHNGAKTHCANGHEFGESNFYRQNGRRVCKTCRAINQKAWRERKKLAS